jgi:hypothetical protein
MILDTNVILHNLTGNRIAPTLKIINENTVLFVLIQKNWNV